LRDSIIPISTGTSVFSAKTRNPKIYISTPPGTTGKGRNVINILGEAENLGAQYVMLFDGDVTSFRPDEIGKYMQALTSGYDFVLPFYARTKLDGSITNNLVYPMVALFWGRGIRQPIGGDFALNKKFYKHILKQKLDGNILVFGIDIFLTASAVISGASIIQAHLGIKTHSPSLKKLEYMFPQVASALFDRILSEKKFHEFALQSALFKGRSDWYFCYLKAEKVAHVLAILSSTSSEHGGSLRELAHTASKLPESVVRFAADEIERSNVLADIFALLSAVRFVSTVGGIGKENALLLIEEYEQLAQKIGNSSRPSPFVSSDDFSLPPLPEHKNLTSSPARLNGFSVSGSSVSLKDKSKGRTISKGQKLDSKEKQGRMSQILDVIRKQKGASVKDISAVVKNYSEKTIQRELALLIKQGLVRKEGERRWSIYIPVSGI